VDPATGKQVVDNQGPGDSQRVRKIIAEVVIKREPEEQKKGFIAWLNANKEAVGIVVLVVGAVVSGLWTFYSYIQQEKEKTELQRKAMLVQFYGDLGDKNKRNTAAYALATISGDAAIPVLMPKLQEAIEYENDPSFVHALTQALIMIGEPAAKEAARINREFHSTSVAEAKEAEVRTKVLDALQLVLVDYMRHASSRATSISLAGIELTKPEFSGADLSGLELRDARINGGDFCGANLEGVVLEKASITEAQLGDANLSRANLHRANLSESNLDSTKFDKADLTEATLPQQMSNASFRSTVLANWNLVIRYLARAHFDDANLVNARFEDSDLYRASFARADLTNTRFFSLFTDNPTRLHGWKNPLISPGHGAFVLEASFAGAKGVSEETRKYLCKWGAKDVPGGCVDTPTALEVSKFENDGMDQGSSTCW